MNILILAAGENELNIADNGYPFYLSETEGIPFIERLVKQCACLPQTTFLFAIAEEEVKRWRMDSVITQLTPNSHLIRVPGKTAGAACTALLAVEYIDTDEPLLILNANDIMDVNFLEVIKSFVERQLDAGTIVFPSIHPRYSYVALDTQGLVVEAAEKNPISHHATTGFYWFAHGRQFVAAARSMIIKDGHLNGIFYICPILNEYILAQAKVGVWFIEKQHYHPLKSARQLQQFELGLENGKSV